MPVHIPEDWHIRLIPAIVYFRRPKISQVPYLALTYKSRWATAGVLVQMPAEAPCSWKRLSSGCMQANVDPAGCVHCEIGSAHKECFERALPFVQHVQHEPDHILCMRCALRLHKHHVTSEAFVIFEPRQPSERCENLL